MDTTSASYIQYLQKRGFDSSAEEEEAEDEDEEAEEDARGEDDEEEEADEDEGADLLAACVSAARISKRGRRRWWKSVRYERQAWRNLQRGKKSKAKPDNHRKRRKNCCLCYPRTSLSMYSPP